MDEEKRAFLRGLEVEVIFGEMGLFLLTINET